MTYGEKTMWSKPWKMKEGSVICICLFAICVILQLIAGPLDWNLFAWPVNLIALILFLGSSLAIFLLRNRFYFFEFMGSLKAAVPSMMFVCGITVIMGLTRQNDSADAPVGLLGFSRMLSSWPFVLLYLWMALIVCQAVLKEGRYWKWRRLPAFAFHLGLLLVLLTGTLGSADMSMLSMAVNDKLPEKMAVDDNGKMHELPISILLRDFDIREDQPGRIQYIADISIWSRGGKEESAVLSVNKPFRIDGRKIYLSDFDETKGADSDTCTLDIVSDPWLPGVYAGIYLMLAGAACMIFMRKSSSKQESE